ncbi:hypothetical protein [Maritalea porphyrae]|uniref:hypothetical protein n=1 Tax=Maritalea porphyrae TaxID=880732 RepID=UPI0022AF90F8|nr:hypothetical protein [Maritalea porphyrae]MCZ4270783.1 hypothetical protein [Maritalea porphyrae]
MSKIPIQEATLEVEQDDIGQCSTCRELAIDGEKYCSYCKDYWADVENGMFDDESGIND